jgi:DNA-binding transcriptional ArsR family regulator
MSTTELADVLSLTRAQVTRAMSDLRDAGLVEAIGSPRRLRYAPVERDPLARSLWGAWRDVAYAPWLEIARAATDLVAARDLLARDGRVGATTEALQRYERNAALLTSVCAEPHPRHAAGSARDVGAQLAPIIDDTVRELVTVLDGTSSV